MVDRAGRDRLALLLRRLASGRITNADFEGERLDRSTDEALVALGDAGWSLYNDFGIYRLHGKHALSPDALKAVARCVLFLDTDLHYEWPPRRASVRGILTTLLTLGLSLRRERRAWESSGPYHVWPFYRESDYQEACAHPRFLAGADPEQAA